MLYKTLNIDELINTKEADREIVELMENNGAHLKIAALKKHAEIEPHMSHTDVCIYVTDGEIELRFSAVDNCTCSACGCSMPDDESDEEKKYKVKKDQLFLFEKNVMHAIKALKDSSFLVIKI